MEYIQMTRSKTARYKRNWLLADVFTTSKTYDADTCILLNFFVTVKAAPHERGNRTGLLETMVNAENEVWFQGIIELFAFCKGGNFQIHIWAWFGYFIC